MNCPKCQTPMREREKDDVVMDICPNCRGIWLDAGELEKLTQLESRYYRRDRREWDDDDDDDDDRRYGASYNGDRQGQPDRQGPQRRGGFLSNIFENFSGGGD